MKQTVEYALRAMARHNGSSGTCWSDPSNIDRLNEVIALIHERGDFTGTVDWLVVNFNKGEFCLPVDFESIKFARSCTHPVSIRDSFYSVVDRAVASSSCRGVLAITEQESVSEIPWRRPYCCKPDGAFTLRAISTDPGDSGSKISVTGIIGGRMETESISLVGESLVNFDGVFTDIIDVAKPVTLGTIKLYGATSDDNDCYLVGEWPPDIENPRYTRYHINGCRSGSGQLLIFAKRRPQRLTRLDQLVPIESMQALKFGYQAIRANDAGDDNEYVSKLQLMENQLEKADMSLDGGDVSYLMDMVREFA